MSGIAAPKLRAAGKLPKLPRTPEEVNVVTGEQQKSQQGSRPNSPADLAHVVAGDFGSRSQKNGEPGVGGTAATAAANPDGKDATEAVVEADGVANAPTRHVGVVAPRRAQDEEVRSLYFQDGKRRIDFVLAYLKGDDSGAENYRRIFEDNLLKEGLDLELEDAAASAVVSLLQSADLYMFGRVKRWQDQLPEDPRSLEGACEIRREASPPDANQGQKRGKVVAFPTVTVAKGEKPVLPDLKYLESEATEVENDGKPNALEALWAKLWTPFPYNKELIPDETQYFNAEFVRQREHM
ncbi:hypothetical protein HPB49_020316 [Dermacentor silvarum]|uniref:Uncharacterized protein n=1 Tax=Dermacentor silvarum TaxID=543639 RepID=A0ACB8C596_DERSI|nr:hypothetical protein HPB49_020316 [Dermacentor silvarum]